MKLDSLRDVLVDCIKDLYSAETQLLKALPKMAEGASHSELSTAFTAHAEETQRQVERLEKVCELLGIRPGGKTCVAMKGLIEEGKELLKEEGTPAARDAALIGAAQKVEHYEIAGYGTARTFATLLGEKEAARLLHETLKEEEATDKKLTGIARSGLNQAAAAQDGERATRPAARARR